MAMIDISFDREKDTIWHTKYQHRPLQDLPKFTQIGIFLG
jgi:hypothetical protein